MSIYDDINEINKAYYLLNNADETGTMEVAAAAIEADEYDEEKLIAYSHSKSRGFYVKNRKLELDEERLLFLITFLIEICCKNVPICI